MEEAPRGFNNMASGFDNTNDRGNAAGFGGFYDDEGQPTAQGRKIISFKSLSGVVS